MARAIGEKFLHPKSSLDPLTYETIHLNNFYEPDSGTDLWIFGRLGDPGNADTARV